MEEVEEAYKQVEALLENTKKVAEELERKVSREFEDKDSLNKYILHGVKERMDAYQRVLDILRPYL
jgi:formiminotetrahydrofolate cyclodeaminase